MMPESIITHRASALKYYLLHSGVMIKKKSGIKGVPDKTLPENSYLILQYNEKSKQYDLAISTTISKRKTKIIPMNKNEINQLWSVIRVNNTNFRLVSMQQPNYYLSIKPHSNLREYPMIKTVPKSELGNSNDKYNTTIFTNNKPAFGSSFNILSNDLYDKSDKHNYPETPYRYIDGVYKPY